ncbi:helix-turn-helix transcriptional regulator [Tropicimonas marinistellae]|uniref:helix-turn-helix transcriptional regulator n=1 Tax=Tropicimonas marinistellae TaxID=1739787 RepID=UPI00082F58CA|nr:hypothetical protein [Tropicimonas marinistellae]
MNLRTDTAIAALTVTQDQSANPNKRIPAHTVRELCGGISDMSLWRWLNDPALNFPKPIYIARRRYWREVEIIDWLESRESVAA